MTPPPNEHFEFTIGRPGPNGLRVWFTRQQAIEAIQRLSSQLMNAETADIEVWWPGKLTKDETE